MRERGLKYERASLAPKGPRVAPHAGAWIEIRIKLANEQEQSSFPMRGAWIEIWATTAQACRKCLSLPMRGAWIEILPHRQPGIGNKKALKGAFLFFIYSFLIFRQCSYCLTGRGGRSLRGLWRRG